MATTALLDVDGTLVDSNYWHVAAWIEAFTAVGSPQPGWKLHRALGMGGDRLVSEVAGDDAEKAFGDDVRGLWKDAYDRMLDRVQAFPQAGDLIRALAERGLTVVLASSGKPDHLERARELLGADDAITAVTTGDDVDSTKPAGDLFELALERAGGGTPLVIGDAPWDAQAARAVRAPVIGLRCGGFPDDDLIGAGVVTLADDPADLLARLDQVLGR